MASSLSIAPAAPRARVARRAGASLVSAGLALLGVALVAGAWQLVAWASDPTIVPPPADVLRAVSADWSSIPAVEFLLFQTGGIGGAVAYTTVNVLLGVGLGTAAGLPLGIVMSRTRVVSVLLELPLLALGTVPLLVILPFLTLWFGTARVAQFGLVLVFALLTVTFAMQSAGKTVGEHYAHYAASLGASPRRVLWTVVLPGSAPAAVGAIRVALAAGWGLETVAELLGASSGAGRVIQATAQIAATTDLLATVLVLAAIALVVDAVATLIGGFVVRWKE